MTPKTDPAEARAADAEPAPVDHRSTATLLADSANQISELVRKELQLFRAEVGEKVNDAFAALGMIVGGIVVALVALNALMAALIAGLAALGLGEGWAALIAGVAVALIGCGLVNSGLKSLKASSLAPHRTADSLRRDAETARETAR